MSERKNSSIRYFNVIVNFMVWLLNYSLIHIAREPLSLFGVKKWFFSIYGTTVKLQSNSQQRQSVLIIWRGERLPTRFYLSFNLDGWKMRNHSQRKVVLVGLRANRDSKKLKGSNFGKNFQCWKLTRKVAIFETCSVKFEIEVEILRHSKNFELQP